MRRLLTSLALAIVALGAVAGTATATHSNGEGPDKDFVTGTAQLLLETSFGTFPAQLHINAQTGPQGQGGTQGMWYTRIFAPFGEEDLSGDTLCMNADGNASTDRGVINQSSGPITIPLGFGVIGFHTDNGEPGHGDGNPPDTTSGFLTPPPGPNPICPSGIDTGADPVLQGNYVVHDGI